MTVKLAYPQRTTWIKATKVELDGDRLLIVHLDNFISFRSEPQPNRSSGEVYIFVDNELLGCFFVERGAF